MAESSRAELPDEVHAEITRLCETGDRLREQGDPDGARRSYAAALRLVPEPRAVWDATLWIYVAAGDLDFSLGNFDAALNCFGYAMQACPRAFGNPFIHMRLGQCLLETGRDDAVAEELIRAYALAGPEIFDEDDPKYLRFLATKAQGISDVNGVQLS